MTKQTLSGATAVIPLWFRNVAPRAGIFALLWWILTEGDWASWGVGMPVLVASTYATFLLRSPNAWRWNLVGLARFLPMFVWFSLRGGLDVAQRALHPHCPLAPELLIYPLRLPVGPARVFFANTVSLLPGTLSAELEDDRLTVHSLDATLPILESLGYLESLVSGLFGLDVSSKEPSRVTCDD